MAPWSAAVAGDATSASPRTADGSAALARLVLIDSGVLTVDVAQSSSHAQHDGFDSSGSASSDGLVVHGANAVTLVVLHAERQSDGKGSTYLVDLNGNKIGTDADLSQCPLSLDPLGKISVNCVSASGGPGGVLTSTASVVGASLGGGALTAQGVTASGNTAHGSAAPAPADVVSSADTAAPASLPAIDQGSAARGLVGGSLPRTGAAGLGVLSLLGVGLATVGEALRRFGRAGRRRAEGVTLAS